MSNHTLPSLLLPATWLDSHAELISALKTHYRVQVLDSLQPIDDILEGLETLAIDVAIGPHALIAVFTVYASLLAERGLTIRHMVTEEDVPVSVSPIVLKLLGVCATVQKGSSAKQWIKTLGEALNDGSCKTLFSHRAQRTHWSFDLLTSKKVDRDLVALVADGLTDKEIGTVLNYSPYTVRNKVSAVLASTGLRNRTELAVMWRCYSVVREFSAQPRHRPRGPSGG